MEQALLKALVAHVASQENTPSELQQLLGQYQDDSHRATGKTMHKLVSKQQEARRGLTKVRSDRTAFEAAWNGYIDHLAQLLETQMGERQEAFRSFDQAEEAWRQQLEETTAALSKHAATEVAEPLETINLDDDMEVQEQIVADAAEEDVKNQVKRQQQREEADARANAVLQSLQALKGDRRDGSRTPRRSVSKERAADPKEAKEEPKDAKGKGTEAKTGDLPPGNARV